jgi:hypothetical protein
MEHRLGRRGIKNGPKTKIVSIFLSKLRKKNKLKLQGGVNWKKSKIRIKIEQKVNLDWKYFI